MKTAIITGITGQDGAYLSKLLLEKDYRVVGILRQDAEENFFGLEYLGIKDRISFEKCSLLNLQGIEDILRKYEPDEIYNLAAQSSVGISFEKPQETINFNILSVLNLLEGIKNCDKSIRFYQASSSDMFGNIESLPVTEKSIIHPTSPYGISKAAAHWITINYRESYSLYACCGILFNHESFLRTPNFFVKKVINAAFDIKKGLKNELRLGNIDLRRDFGYAPEYVKAMWMMLQQKKADEFIICSGQSITLREIVEYIFDKMIIDRCKIITDKSLFRPNDIKNIYGDNKKAKTKLKWSYNKSFFEIIDLMIEESKINE